MRWKDVQAALKKVAPAAASAIGGPIGGFVTAVVADKLGVEPTPAAVAHAIATDPDAAVKLAGIEAELARMQIEDVQNARATFRGHWMPPVLTLVLLAVMAAFCGALLFVEIPAANLRVVDTAFGAVLGAFSTAIAYWLGSSRGSADKQASLAAVLRSKD